MPLAEIVKALCVKKNLASAPMDFINELIMCVVDYQQVSAYPSSQFNAN